MTTGSPTPPPPRPGSPRRLRSAAIVLAVLAGLAWGGFEVFDRTINSEQIRARNKLFSPDPEIRKRGAWMAAETHSEPAARMMNVLLRSNAEPSDDLRETYVYALGKGEWPFALQTLEDLLTREPSGYVRAATWLAISRISPERFAELDRSGYGPREAWDRIGLAQGWFQLDDSRGLEVLLATAVDGDDGQREVASRALYKWVRPLLETAGRWPIEASVQEGQTWPAELVADVRRRGAGLDLRSIAQGSREYWEPTERLQKNVRKITKTRDRIAAVLFAGRAPAPRPDGRGHPEGRQMP